MKDANEFRVGQELYRYGDARVGHAADFEDDYSTIHGCYCVVSLEVYTVYRVTRKGAWYRYGRWGTERFVLWGSRKKYAWPTKEQAWQSFCIRKRRRVGHLEQQLVYAKVALRRSLEHPPLDCRDDLLVAE